MKWLGVNTAAASSARPPRRAAAVVNTNARGVGGAPASRLLLPPRGYVSSASWNDPATNSSETGALNARGWTKVVGPPRDKTAASTSRHPLPRLAAFSDPT